MLDHFIQIVFKGCIACHVNIPADSTLSFWVDLFADDDWQTVNSEY